MYLASMRSPHAIPEARSSAGGAREARRLETRARLFETAGAEIGRYGLAGADVSAIATAAGVVRGTFYFHFPTKEHVLLELEKREEDRMAKQFGRYLDKCHDLESALSEAARLGWPALTCGSPSRLALARTLVLLSGSGRPG